jgi:hypothetical protein
MKKYYKSSRLTAFLTLTTLYLIIAPACGYRVASKNRLDSVVKTLAVRPLENQTTAYEVEQILTRAVVAEFVKRSSFKVIGDPDRADTVLEGAITRVTVNPVTFVDSAFASTFLVTVYARVDLKECNGGEVLFQEDNYIFREQYVINQEVESFFSEANPALERISEDFASSLVTTVLEDF